MHINRKRSKIVICCWLTAISVLVLIIGVPYLINVVFTCDKKVIPTMLQEKDVLSYYTSLLGIALTITTFWLAYRQTIERIAHTQKYNRMSASFTMLKKKTDECFEVIHPYQLMKYRLISSKNLGHYIYDLTHDMEAYKLSVTIVVDSLRSEMRSANELTERRETKAFIDELVQFKSNCIKVTDNHLAYYKEIYTGKSIDSDSVFSDKMHELDGELIKATDQYNLLLTKKEDLFRSWAQSIAAILPGREMVSLE